MYCWLTSLQAQQLPAPELITSQQGLPQAFVPAIIQDRQGFIWMATRDGLCRYDGNTFKVFQPRADGRPALSSSEVTKIVPDRQGKLWLISEAGDVDWFDPARETFLNVSRLDFYKQAIGLAIVESGYVDRQNYLWLCLRDDGLVRLDLPNRRLWRYRQQPGHPSSLNINSVRSVVEDRHGVMWMATQRGLGRLDRRTGQVQQVSPTASLPENALKALLPLANGDLLLRSNRYVIVFDPRTERVRHTYPLPAGEEWWEWGPLMADHAQHVFIAQHNRLFRFNEREGFSLAARLPENFIIKSLFVDRSNVLWVGSDGAGVLKYNLNAGAFSAFPYQVSFHNDVLVRQLGLDPGRVPNPPPSWSYQFRSTIDGTGKLWFNLRTAPFYRVDLPTKRVTSVPFPIQFPTSAPDFPVPMATDPQGRVWAVADSLAFWYDEPANRWVSFPHRFQHRSVGVSVESMILEVVVDEQALWMATRSTGLYRVDRHTGAVRQYAHNPKNPASISNNNLFCLFADPDDSQILWIGTFGSGLCRFDKRTGLSRRLTTADGLPNNVIYEAIPDRYGALWIATNQGLGRMDRRTFRTRIYTREDGLAGDEFNRHHYLRLPKHGTANERILLGGLEGITSFDPGNLHEDTYQPPVQITSIQVNNQPVSTGTVPVQILSELTLPYNQNFVTVQFAAMQYNRRNKIRYRYQLEGLEAGWTETDRPITVYTGLQPGRYTLRLNAANTAGVWSTHVRTLQLTIEPPLWATWWAYVIYGLILGGIVYGLVRASINRLKLQQSVLLKQKEVELKQQEAEQLRATSDMKTRFFANITHEFRTPLTLILAPTEQMVSEQPEPKNRRRLLTIEQNAQHLLRLINQLLDLSRLEASVMPIHESRGDLTECVRRWIQPLSEQARQQGLTLSFTSSLEGSYWFDAEKLERIVYNLTANALKFTQQGQISVGLTPAPEGVTLTISDTGIGISARHLPHIFNRFYRVEDPQSDDLRQAGTGIGLALVKELVQLQDGQISVESQLNLGTTFVVKLPYRQAESREDRAEGIGQTLTNDQQTTYADTSDRDLLDRSSPEPRADLLIVEDNDDLAHFIADSLPDTYRIRRAVDGQDGLTQAQEHQPDLIISDVMMPAQGGPDMDGFMLCDRLKTDLRTSHIPVILLTAKVSADDRLEGLSAGADDYLTKPFQVRELQLRVRNQLASKRRQREWVRASLVSPTTTPDPAASETPDPFLASVYTLIETHLSDPHFGVEQLMTELGMSRTALFRKVKALADLSANELLRQYRLKRAAQFLRDGHAITETAYRVGFESPAYFTKCFRETYRLTPREFVAQA
ncbi:hybrid sensor histidine kinase/response regulator transcription factor [Spirosoma koreense]